LEFDAALAGPQIQAAREARGLSRTRCAKLLRCSWQQLYAAERLTQRQATADRWIERINRLEVGT
jgi:hypothetical protein